jgi:uncharacterized Zn finger protein
MSGGAVQPTRINPGHCPRCGGKPDLKDTVGSLKTGSPMHFLQCKDCGHVHTVEQRSA